MSEPIAASIPTSADPRSKRPTKKRALSPTSQQANQVEHLFAHPDREIRLPSGPKAKTLAPPPEIVANVQGSSAGAGSGEFHVYKASRRREYERLRLMEEEVAKEKAEKDFGEKMESLRRKDEEKTGKNRKKRQKRKDKEKNAGSVERDMKDAPELKVAASQKETNAKERREGFEEEPVPQSVEESNGLVIHDDD